ncbi:hypothetical protein ACJYIC_003447 [Enterobacter hormaechei]
MTTNQQLSTFAITSQKKPHHPSDNKTCMVLMIAFIFSIPYAAALNAALLEENNLKVSLAWIGKAFAVIWIGYDLSKLKEKTKFHVIFTIAAKAIPAILALIGLKFS